MINQGFSRSRGQAAGRRGWGLERSLMKERDITMQQVLTCLAKGKVVDNPFLTHINGGGYETTIERIVAGDHLRIGVCLKFSQKILVITAIKYK